MMSSTPPVYLDYNATTPLDPRVFESMQEWFVGAPANSGSRTHVYGQRARDAVEGARQQVADVLSARPEEIFFTSGATESNNIAILGLAEFAETADRKHILTTAIEHKAVLGPLAQMRQRGFEVDLLPVTAGGYVEPDTVRERLRSDTLLVTVMHANNETGVLQPVHEIASLLDGTEVFFTPTPLRRLAKRLISFVTCRVTSFPSAVTRSTVPRAWGLFMCVAAALPAGRSIHCCSGADRNAACVPERSRCH